MFGYNRYALVLAITATFGLGVTTVGCSGSKSRGGAASTVAPSTSSGSTTSPTTSGSTTTPLADGPTATAASFVDADQNNMVGKGDKIVLTFDAEVAPITTAVDPASEFTLPVVGDGFGANAAVKNSLTNSREVEIVLGDNPNLRVSDAFDLAFSAPGSASGINVATSASGGITGVGAGAIRPALSPLDLGGTLKAGFYPAASVNVARGGHAAVQLDDGRVLVIGGVSAKDTYIKDAEIYDPVTNTWTVVSDLVGSKDGRMRRGSIEARMVNASAVKLADGTVLICGGYGIEKKGLFGLGKEKVDTLEGAYVFDPTTNTFSKVGDMNYSRHSHTATLLNDGKVLIAGGYNDSFWKSDKTQAPFEVYDPAKKTFAKIGSIFSRFKLKEPRQNHTATAIEGGSGVLFAGGEYYSGGGLFGLIKPKLNMAKGAEVARGTNTEKTGNLAEPRMNHAAALVTPREVLIAGGHDHKQLIGSVELYDSATAQWKQVGALSAARTGCQIASDKNQVLIIGGTDGTAEVSKVEVFNADAKQMSADTFSLQNARNGFTVTKLKDGRILVVGGLTGATKDLKGLDGQAIASCELFVRQ